MYKIKPANVPTAAPAAAGACRVVSSFSKLDKLGEGTYGSVYRARDRDSGDIVALKRVKLSGAHFEREGMPLTSLREVSLLRRLRHPNVVQLQEVVVGSKLDSLFLVFECCEHDLAHLLDTMKSPFLPAEVKSLMKQIFGALAYLHASGVLHRDLKLSNCLLKADGALRRRPPISYARGVLLSAPAPRGRHAQGVRLRAGAAGGARRGERLPRRGRVHAQSGDAVVPRARAAAGRAEVRRATKPPRVGAASLLHPGCRACQVRPADRRVVGGVHPGRAAAAPTAAARLDG